MAARKRRSSRQKVSLSISLRMACPPLKACRHANSSTEERALYTVSGEINVAGTAFGPAQLLVFRPGDQIVVAATANARFMLFGGAPMGGPRYIWWNFVSRSQRRVGSRAPAGGFDIVPERAQPG